MSWATALSRATAFFDSPNQSSIIFTASIVRAVLTLSTTEQPFTLNLTNVTEVDVAAMASGDGYWEMDNVNYTAGATVPEPANLGVVGAMLIAIAAASRFRPARKSNRGL